MSPTVTPSITVTPTVTPTPDLSPTPTPTMTPTKTVTPTITPTKTVTPTVTRTPTLTQTPTITPTTASNIFNVSNAGSGAYVINGQSNPTLTLTEGETYIFNVNASGHPFWIKTISSTGTGNAYNTGVTGNGTQSGTLTFVVPYDAPSTLYYNCQYHGGMAGSINIVNVVPPSPTPTPTVSPTKTPTPTSTVTPTSTLTVLTPGTIIGNNDINVPQNHGGTGWPNFGSIYYRFKTSQTGTLRTICFRWFSHYLNGVTNLLIYRGTNAGGTLVLNTPINIKCNCPSIPDPGRPGYQIPEGYCTNVNTEFACYNVSIPCTAGESFYLVLDFQNLRTNIPNPLAIVAQDNCITPVNTTNYSDSIYDGGSGCPRYLSNFRTYIS